MKEPVDHIVRPKLPWRTDAGITECGYNADKVPTISRTAYFDRKKALGQQRSAMLTCMTCADTATRWGTWEDDPRQAIRRELDWEGGYGYHRKDRGNRTHDELLAIEVLIAAHRDEFDAHVLATEQRREWLEKKAARVPAKPQTARERGLL